MSRIEKLKRRIAENPQGIRFEEVVRVLQDLGWMEVRRQGSHVVFRPSGNGPSIVIVRPHGGRKLCHIADIRRVIEILDEQENRS